MMKIQYFFKTFVFILIFCILFSGLNTILKLKDYPAYINLNINFSPYILASKLDGFYKMKKDSLDAIFLGSSHVHTSINPNVIWSQYGFTSYDLSGDQQDYMTAYYYFVEALKYQSPKVVVFEVEPSTEYLSSVAAHFSFDFMKPSLNKLQAIRTRVEKNFQSEVFFPFIVYHSRWQDLNKNDFTYLFDSRGNRFKGYFANLAQNPQTPEKQDMNGYNKTYELSKQQLEYLGKIYNLCKRNNIKLILMTTPSAIDNHTKPFSDAISKYVDGKDITYFDYTFKYDEFGLDFLSDYVDIVHMNIWGAEKFSKKFAKDILNVIHLQDKRGNIQYTEWDEDVKYYYALKENYELTMSPYPLKISARETIGTADKVVLNQINDVNVWNTKSLDIKANEYYSFSFETDAKVEDVKLFYANLYGGLEYDRPEQHKYITLNRENNKYSGIIYTGAQVPTKNVIFRLVSIPNKAIEIRNLVIQRCKVDK